MLFNDCNYSPQGIRLNDKKKAITDTLHRKYFEA